MSSYLQQLRAWVYDTAIVWFTAEWYARVLRRLPNDALVLDVGIGTAAALLTHEATLRAQRLVVVGLDIDEAYVQRAHQLVGKDRAELVSVHLQSVYDHTGGPYDAVYFSGSFMLMPDPDRALQHVRSLLKPGGSVYFTQTFQRQRSYLLETIKPMLVYLTTIDFGRVTYEEDFRACLVRVGATVTHEEVISESYDRCAKLIVIQ